MLKPFTVEMSQPQADRIDITIKPDDLLQAVRALVEENWGYLTAIVGLDRPAPARVEGQPPQEGAIEILYLFCSGAAVVALRFALPYSQAVVPTISGMLPPAMLYEWELKEMLGVDVVGLRMTGHLILADDWPEGVYPLRKSFTGFNSSVSSDRSTIMSPDIPINSSYPTVRSTGFEGAGQLRVSGRRRDSSPVGFGAGLGYVHRHREGRRGAHLDANLVFMERSAAYARISMRRLIRWRWKNWLEWRLPRGPAPSVR